MKKYLKISLILGLSLALPGLVLGQIPVWLPDITAAPGSTVNIPVSTGEVIIPDSVLAYFMQINYDPAFANPDTTVYYNLTGAITPGSGSWENLYYVDVPGQLLGGAFDNGNTVYLTGSGILTNLVFIISPTATGTMPLLFGGVGFVYGEGTPAVVTTNGSITISVAPPEPPLVVASIQGDNIVLTWVAVTGATSYNVYRSANPYFDPTTVYANTTSTTYTDTGAFTTGPWFYIVTSNN